MRRLFAYMMMETAPYLRFYVMNNVFHKEKARLLQAQNYLTAPELAV
jgi:hypothetical protein